MRLPTKIVGIGFIPTLLLNSTRITQIFTDFLSASIRVISVICVLFFLLFGICDLRALKKSTEQVIYANGKGFTLFWDVLLLCSFLRCNTTGQGRERELTLHIASGKNLYLFLHLKHFFNNLNFEFSSLSPIAFSLFPCSCYLLLVT